MEKLINCILMPIRISSRINPSLKDCIKVIVPIGISRYTVESILQTKTKYKVNRPKRSEIEKITDIFDLEEAIEYIAKINFHSTFIVKKEKVTKQLVDSFWYDPEFTTNYINGITFFNTRSSSARKYLAGELYPRCFHQDDIPNGNYYTKGEYSLECEEGLLDDDKFWVLYKVIRSHTYETKVKILEK